jgi:hypothetical protein
MHTGCCWGNPTEEGDLETLRVDERILLKLVLKRWDGTAWAGFLLVRAGISGEGVVL